MTTDDTLAAFFAQDEPPARDPAFVLGVAEAIAAQDFRRDIVRRGALAIAVGAIAWTLAPLVPDLGGTPVLPLVILAAVVAGAGVLAPRLLRLIPVFGPTRA
ncbi:hypothetical protein [Hyphobacterium marinum]|uniref:Holin-X, holin superfamily III n=1 Tax=Hyphobacterium marinum TaxID=3116574 RepID=A0ABU7M037_9PROT|nr:hypothetical protein [Hyphobacterium sp. Y6023]MEE2567159.1 hypothetical protein [Hyphobacterium sp. Y6023]